MQACSIKLASAWMRVHSLGVGGVTTLVTSNGDQTWERFYVKIKEGSK